MRFVSVNEGLFFERDGQERVRACVPFFFAKKKMKDLFF